MSVVLSALQVGVVVGASACAGAEFSVSARGWPGLAAAAGFAVAMYGAAEVLANRLPTQEERTGRCRPSASCRGSCRAAVPHLGARLRPTVIAKALPITHVLALLRYGLVDPRLRAPRHLGHVDTTTMAWASLAVVAAFALVMTVVSFRVFRRAAVS